MSRAAQDHPLATLKGLAAVLSELARAGALCPRCGHGTRAKSRLWAECPKCGERVWREERKP